MFVCGDESETKVFHGVREVGVGEAWSVGDGDERARYAEGTDFILRVVKKGLNERGDRANVGGGGPAEEFVYASFRAFYAA